MRPAGSGGAGPPGDALRPEVGTGELKPQRGMRRSPAAPEPYTDEGGSRCSTPSGQDQAGSAEPLLSGAAPRGTSEPKRACLPPRPQWLEFAGHRWCLLAHPRCTEAAQSPGLCPSRPGTRHVSDRYPALAAAQPFSTSFNAQSKRDRCQPNTPEPRPELPPSSARCSPLCNTLNVEQTPALLQRASGSPRRALRKWCPSSLSLRFQWHSYPPDLRLSPGVVPFSRPRVVLPVLAR